MAKIPLRSEDDNKYAIKWITEPDGTVIPIVPMRPADPEEKSIKGEGGTANTWKKGGGSPQQKPNTSITRKTGGNGNSILPSVAKSLSPSSGIGTGNYVAPAGYGLNFQINSGTGINPFGQNKNIDSPRANNAIKQTIRPVEQKLAPESRLETKLAPAGTDPVYDATPEGDIKKALAPQAPKEEIQEERKPSDDSILGSLFSGDGGHAMLTALAGMVGGHLGGGPAGAYGGAGIAGDQLLKEQNARMAVDNQLKVALGKKSATAGDEKPLKYNDTATIRTEDGTVIRVPLWEALYKQAGSPTMNLDYQSQQLDLKNKKDQSVVQAIGPSGDPTYYRRKDVEGKQAPVPMKTFDDKFGNTMGYFPSRDPNKISPVQINKGEAYGQKGVEISDKATSTFASSVKGLGEEIANAESSMKLLETGNVLPMKMAINYLVKITEGGRPSDSDRSFVLGAQGYYQKLKEWLLTDVKGTDRERLISDAKVALNMIMQGAPAIVENRARKISASYSLGNKELEKDTYRKMMAIAPYAQLAPRYGDKEYMKAKEAFNRLKNGLSKVKKGQPMVLMYDRQNNPIKVPANQVDGLLKSGNASREKK